MLEALARVLRLDSVAVPGIRPGREPGGVRNLVARLTRSRYNPRLRR